MKLVADLLVRNGRLIDPLKGTVQESDLSIKDGKVLSFSRTAAREVIDAAGCYVSCGFIESHLHVEGLHLLPEHFCRAFLAHGTTTIITDLHEVANAGGLSGLQWYLSLADLIPLDLFLMAPSCVPSSRFETGAGRIGVAEVKRLKALRRVIGLGEVMDVEGVTRRRRDMMKKINLFEGRPVDGHAPGLIGNDLDLYMSAGIHSDHETTRLDEGEEKLRKGMHLFLREGSVAKDLDCLLPLITPDSIPHLSLCTDDLSARDLWETGHLDRLISRLIRSGISLFDALRLVTSNPALYFGLHDRNGLFPGRKADLVIFDRPEDLRVLVTIKNGRIVYRQGQTYPESGSPKEPSVSLNQGTVPLNVAAFSHEALRQRAKGRLIRVMEVMEGTILMGDLSTQAHIGNGYLAADPGRDIVFAYAFDRYRAEEAYGFGLVKGFLLKEGAIGTTYAHDSHNLVVVGDNIEDIYEVLQILKNCGGGMAASRKGRTVCLPMSHLGIVSSLDAQSFLQKEAELADLVREMGVRLKNPFLQMSFLSLPVIPHLRLTTKGLFHVTTSKYVKANHD